MNIAQTTKRRHFISMIASLLLTSSFGFLVRSQKEQRKLKIRVQVSDPTHTATLASMQSDIDHSYGVLQLNAQMKKAGKIEHLTFAETETAMEWTYTFDSYQSLLEWRHRMDDFGDITQEYTSRGYSFSLIQV